MRIRRRRRRGRRAAAGREAAWVRRCRPPCRRRTRPFRGAAPRDPSDRRPRRAALRSACCRSARDPSPRWPRPSCTTPPPRARRRPRSAW
ncbi:MAG: hypothetical protein F9K40_13100 [Kofleriaceae bacterium]|nr:MAG: hypothetical protein F9K40_13100 [Kofleriaceae bacterium]